MTAYYVTQYRNCACSLSLECWGQGQRVRADRGRCKRSMLQLLSSVAKAAQTPTPVRGTRMACEAKGAPCCALPLPVPSPPSFALMRTISAPSEPAREQTRRRQRQFSSGHIRPEESVHMKCINRAPCWARRMAAGCATGPPGGRKAGRCVRGSAGARLTVLEALFLHS